ncbi:MAG: winged helix-turn-helix domain-containing protein [Phycisphaerales bacterium]|nr:winged helix-turn-helix domain-containing protein [Phycisphaerales bacterium]
MSSATRTGGFTRTAHLHPTRAPQAGATCLPRSWACVKPHSYLQTYGGLIKKVFIVLPPAEPVPQIQTSAESAHPPQLRRAVQSEAGSPVKFAGALRVGVRGRVTSALCYTRVRAVHVRTSYRIAARSVISAGWGPTHARDVQYLRMYAGQLRQKLESSAAQPQFLITEPGVGYRLRSPDELL